MASDGKWYPPDAHPDENYRNRFVGEEVTFPTIEIQPETRIDTPEANFVGRAPDLETAEISTDHLSAQLEEVERQRADAERLLFRTETSIAKPDLAPEVVAAPARTFSVSTPASPRVSERPIFDDNRPASVVEAPPRPFSDVVGVVDAPSESEVRGGGPLSASSVTASISSTANSTSLVRLPTASNLGVATARDRIIATLIFCSGVAMIVGTFLTWTTGFLVQTGWDRGDGLFTIAAGVVGSATAGPIIVGFRHVIPKTLAVISGLIGVVVVGLAAIGGVLDSDVGGISLGLGFYVVLVGSTVLVAAALAGQAENLD